MSEQFGFAVAGMQQAQDQHIDDRVKDALKQGLTAEQIMEHTNKGNGGLAEKALQFIPFGEKMFQAQEESNNKQVAEEVAAIREAMMGKHGGATHVEDNGPPAAGGKGREKEGPGIAD